MCVYRSQENGSCLTRITDKITEKEFQVLLRQKKMQMEKKGKEKGKRRETMSIDEISVL